jgi:hypothetical protein
MIFFTQSIFFIFKFNGQELFGTGWARYDINHVLYQKRKGESNKFYLFLQTEKIS